MKRIIKISAVTLVMGLLITFSTQLTAQPNPSGNANGTNTGNTPVGGGAPIGSSLVIMLALGVGYGTKKLFEIRRKVTE